MAKLALLSWLGLLLCVGCATGGTKSTASTCVNGLSGDARQAAIAAAEERVRECERLDRRLPLEPPRRSWPCRYADALQAMGEGPLWADFASESYRFPWMRTFDEPVMVRADRTREGDFLTAKTLDGTGGYVPGRMKREVRRRLSNEETETLLARYRAVSATRLPAFPPGSPFTVGADGARWVFEKVGENVRVVRDLRSPDEPQFSEYRELCVYMVPLAGFERRCATRPGANDWSCPGRPAASPDRNR